MLSIVVKKLRHRTILVMLLGDLFLFTISLIGAYYVRFDFSPSKEWLNQLFMILPLMLLIKIVIFAAFGSYRRMWRYTSLSDMEQLTKAVVVSGVVIFAIIGLAFGFKGFSRGVFVADAVLTFMLTGGFRILIRYSYHWGILEECSRGKAEKDKIRRVILVGAGDGGEKTAREIFDNPSLNYKVVAFVDDDEKKWGLFIHGVPVKGPVDNLPELVKELDAQEIIIAIPSATGGQMRRIVESCREAKVPFKTLPTIGELIDGRIDVGAIREVDYTDLMDRDPVNLEYDTISAYLQGKRVLITGAGGSIGSELCRQVIRFRPELLVMLDNSEANLYAIETEMRHRIHFKNYRSVLADVRFLRELESVMEKFKPDVVVHAAAYKHVPMMEVNPWQAVFNNIIGSWNVMETSTKMGVERFVMVSTDKAVRPTNVMGASKRVCELLMQTYGVDAPVMMSVRFGNVIGSSGSVVPLFLKQIYYGGPVTVTHPEVTRFFMSISEACQLVLQAGALGKGGEIFVLEMGRPVKILKLAEDLIRFCGKEPGRDIEIVFTGLRPGEKLYEELITVGENVVSTVHDKIMVLKSNSNGEWYGHRDREEFREWLWEAIGDLRRFAVCLDGEAIKKKLKEIVPEYQLQGATPTREDLETYSEEIGRAEVPWISPDVFTCPPVAVYPY